MQWIIEHWPINEFGDTQAQPFINALGRAGEDHRIVKWIPFLNEIEGIEAADPSLTTFFYCSVGMAIKVATDGKFRPGVFWQDDWWDPFAWRGQRSDLLNEHIEPISVGDLRKHWVKEPMFVKSVEIKDVTGMVIEPDSKDHEVWLEEHAALLDEDVLAIGPISEKLEREWRFFVVDGKVVTGSTYRKDGYRSVRHPVSEAAWEYAKRAVKEWMPTDTVVIDIARTWSGQYKVVEFNCVNTSGLYRASSDLLVRALMEKLLSSVPDRRYFPKGIQAS